MRQRVIGLNLSVGDSENLSVNTEDSESWVGSMGRLWSLPLDCEKSHRYDSRDRTKWPLFFKLFADSGLWTLLYCYGNACGLEWDLSMQHWVRSHWILLLLGVSFGFPNSVSAARYNSAPAVFKSVVVVQNCWKQNVCFNLAGNKPDCLEMFMLGGSQLKRVYGLKFWGQSGALATLSLLSLKMLEAETARGCCFSEPAKLQARPWSVLCFGVPCIDFWA